MSELEQLRAANAAMKDTIARVSHDLRSPLTSMFGFIELLETTDLDDDQRAQLEVMLRASRRMLAIIDELRATQPA